MCDGHNQSTILLIMSREADKSNIFLMICHSPDYSDILSKAFGVTHLGKRPDLSGVAGKHTKNKFLGP
jgi:hypothetical protein